MKRNTINTRKGFTLVEMLGVLAIIAILISVISVGVLAAINRARTVATISNLKNLETALAQYIALSESSSQIPYTKGTGIVRTANGPGRGATLNAVDDGTPEFCLEAVFLGAQTLDRLPNWRMGNDPVQSGDITIADIVGWNRQLRAFIPGLNASGDAINELDWSNVVRTECTRVDTTVTIADASAADGMMGGGVNFQIDGSSNLPAGRCAYVVIPGLTLSDCARLSEELNGTLNIIDTKLPDTADYRTQTAGRFVVDALTAQTDGTFTAFYYLYNM